MLVKSILFCTPAPLEKSLGHAKVVVELAEEMRLLNWDCKLLCPWDIAEANDPDPVKSFTANLTSYLKAKAADYDVVDYDHVFLPLARSEFNSGPLFVSRSVLLAHHLEVISIPKRRGLKAKLGAVVRGGRRQIDQRRVISQAQLTLEAADLINVSNEDDQRELVKRGFSKDKIVVIPFGISRHRRLLFNRVPSTSPKRPVVAFVGTFDYRKGAREFPKIVQAITHQIPDVRFKLLGLKGMYQTEAEIRSCFPRNIQRSLELVLTYKPEELPQLLSSCSVGIFPSYMEGFGFGVLEMLAASVPVIAYDAPGPPMMLSLASLVPRGDWHGMSEKVVNLLQNEEELMKARLQAKRRSQDFNWDEIAQTTSEQYLTRIAQGHGV